MKKIAFFVEGQTEMIFVERLLAEVAGANRIQVERRVTRGSGEARRLQIGAKSAVNGAEFFALIVDVGSDGAVASDVRENYDGLVRAGFEQIVGIRDVYPLKASDIPRVERLLYYNLRTKPVRPDLLLAVMEVEAWFLAEHTHFARIDSTLSCDRIRAELGFNPSADPMEEREWPAGDLHAAYKLVGKASGAASGPLGPDPRDLPHIAVFYRSPSDAVKKPN